MKMMNSGRLVFLMGVCLLALLAGRALAEGLVSYEFVNGVTAPSFKAAGIEASEVTDPKEPGASIPDYIGVSVNGQIFWDTELLRASFEGPSGSVEGKQYAEFTITPDAGKRVTLQKLRFEYGGNARAEFPAALRVVCVASGVEETIWEQEFNVTYAGDLKPWVPEGVAEIDLAEFGYLKDMNSPVTFRFYARDDNSPQGGLALALVRVGHIVLEGEIAP